jgi:hypothetical protein
MSNRETASYEKYHQENKRNASEHNGDVRESTQVAAEVVIFVVASVEKNCSISG